MLGQIEHLEFSVTQNAATAYLLAEMYRQDSDREEIWLEKARFCAGRIDDEGWTGCFASFAWAAIARASGEQGDLEQARETIEPILPRFTDTDEGPRFDREYSDVLSCHLFLAHALCDMALMEPHAGWRSKALEILKYVFSDMYFDGSFLAHHVENGGPAKVHCTGCNFHALYVADRLYGDTLVLDPLAK
jgi:hypothetical protein